MAEAATNALEDDSPEESGGGIRGRAAQDARAREFRKRRRQVVNKAKKKVQQKIVKKLAAKGTTRLIAYSFGATGVGLVITYAMWTVQVIGGNLLGSKLIPPLDSLGDEFWWELPAWGFLSFLLFLLSILFIALLAPVVILTSSKLEAIKILGQAVWELIEAVPDLIF